MTTIQLFRPEVRTVLGQRDLLTEEILPTPVQPGGHYKNSSQISTVSEQKSESYYSAATSSLRGRDYLTRPLPSTPNEDSRVTSDLKRDDTLKAIHDRANHTSIRQTNKMMTCTRTSLRKRQN
nr:BFH_HP1_G0048660.mRNA.1.CDS.1 [Saccharomyces cerevisiae]